MVTHLAHVAQCDVHTVSHCSYATKVHVLLGVGMVAVVLLDSSNWQQVGSRLAAGMANAHYVLAVRSHHATVMKPPCWVQSTYLLFDPGGMCLKVVCSPVGLS
jgi:hypothetical protein